MSKLPTINPQPQPTELSLLIRDRTKVRKVNKRTSPVRLRAKLLSDSGLRTSVLSPGLGEQSSLLPMLAASGQFAKTPEPNRSTSGSRCSPRQRALSPSLIASRTGDRQATLGVMTLLDYEAQGQTHSSKVSERHKAAWDRRMETLEERMSDRLEQHLVHEEQRNNLSHARTHKDNGTLVARWLTLCVQHKFVAKVQEMRRHHNAQKVIGKFIVMRCMNYLRRVRQRRIRQNLIDSLIGTMDSSSKPTVAEWRTGFFLGRLPDAFLQHVSMFTVPKCFLANEDVALEDVPGSEAFFVCAGKLSLRRHGKPLQRREAGDEVDMGDLEPKPRIVTEGELAFEEILFSDENYEMTATALTDLKLWCIPQKAFRELVQKCGVAAVEQKRPQSSSEVGSSDLLQQQQQQQQQKQATNELRGLSDLVNRLMDERRSVLMERQHRMTSDFIRRSSQIFSSWSQEGIAMIRSRCFCKIYRQKDIVVPANKMGKLVVFVVSGKLEIVPKAQLAQEMLETGEDQDQPHQPVALGKRTDVIREGQATGELELLSRNRTMKGSVVRAVTNCDVWVLRSVDFQEIVCHETPFAVIPAMVAMTQATATNQTGQSGAPAASLLGRGGADGVNRRKNRR